MKTINSTMAGIVSNVLVGKGDAIEIGQEVVIIESMKMQIPIETDIEGVISEVKVNAGDFINEGDVLLIIE
ncbi:biotin/lipoyl-containing protein [Robertmurraya andreesenii]|uniref:Acetyl-CoA carboxylase biotin carboxyl carrier protein n=1 Tax=Anoxybacillus andreesenii TaxID=1325932 RepID=A0ABT9V4N4_9BACL|nr:biotin/lipoyl-containing protein [Robertmurraya andreesenii]MDQ0155904.1 acetyl-CoA carboxylase biotin carboxyl carrier protein [Robertmurraya andreesenii]